MGSGEGYEWGFEEGGGGGRKVGGVRERGVECWLLMQGGWEEEGVGMERKGGG